MGFSPLDLLNPVGAVVDYFQGQSNAKQAREAFQTRYQDTVKDMKKAGLNPALAYGQGGGNPQTHDRPMVGEELTKGANTIASAQQAKANMELTKAQTALLNAQAADLAKKPGLENLNLGAQLGLTEAQTTRTGAETSRIGAETDFTRLKSIGQQTENMILAVDQGLRQNELDYANQTLGDRVKKVAAELKKLGVDTTLAEVQTQLARASIPKAHILESAATGAQQLLNQAAQAPSTLMENFKSWIADQRNKNRHRTNQWNRALGTHFGE
ncbi:MAG: DNA pilot protein [Microvirus sp.]|nr:MAG: DNA pilot protein [Microvirus sp.]